MTESKRILVVEDNDFVRMQMVKFLADAGYSVEEATDGKDAERFLVDPIPDLMVVDVMMEPVGGFGFIRHMHGLGYADTPVILVTGDRNTDLLTQSQKYDVEGVMLKPVKRERFIKQIERTLERLT